MLPVSSDQSVVPVERTAVPADPLWPRVVEGRCTWCGDPESEHEGGVREHHRIEVLGGRYADEPEIVRPGLPAPVDPEAPGVSDADLVAVIAARLAGCVTPTASGWVKLAAVAVGEQLVLTVTTWGPLSAGMAVRVVDRTVVLGEPTVVSRDELGARPDAVVLLWADGTVLPYRRGESCVDWSRFVCAWGPFVVVPAVLGRGSRCPVMACDRAGSFPAAAVVGAHTADAERRGPGRGPGRVRGAGRARGYRRTSDDGALGRAVVAVWALVDEYEGGRS